jgi:hypothetical protein
MTASRGERGDCRNHSIIRSSEAAFHPITGLTAVAGDVQGLIEDLLRVGTAESSSGKVTPTNGDEGRWKRFER